jgi:hypothetical protein
MVETVIATLINSTVDSVAAKVIEIDRRGSPADESLQLTVIEHAEPGGIYHSRKSTEEGICLNVRLVLKAMTGNVRYVHQTVLIGDSDVGAIRLELLGNGHCSTGILVHLDGICYCEVEREIFDIPSVVLELVL